MGRTIGSLYFFLGGEGCVSLLLFVTEAHWRRRNQKQNRNRNKTTSPSSRLVKISPPQRPAQSPVLQASQKIFFFEELKTRNLVFFSRRKTRMNKKGPGSRRDVLIFSWNFSCYKQGVSTPGWYMGTQSDHLPGRVRQRLQLCLTYGRSGCIIWAPRATICSAQLESLCHSAW